MRVTGVHLINGVSSIGSAHWERNKTGRYPTDVVHSVKLTYKLVTWEHSATTVAIGDDGKQEFPKEPTATTTTRTTKRRTTLTGYWVVALNQDWLCTDTTSPKQRDANCIDDCLMDGSKSTIAASFHCL